MWDDAQTNHQNPFHELYSTSTGPYDDRNIRRVGRHLYADMSSEIHNSRGMDFAYELFDPWTKEIANVLVPKDDMRTGTGAVNWKREVRRYPVPDLPDYIPAEMDDSEDMIEGPPTEEDDEDARGPVRERRARRRRRRPTRAP